MLDLKTQLLISGYTLSALAALTVTVGYALMIGLVFTLPSKPSDEQ